VLTPTHTARHGSLIYTLRQVNSQTCPYMYLHKTNMADAMHYIDLSDCSETELHYLE